MSDSVNHPKHYNDGKIEVIEFLEDKNLGFHLGNVVKYVSRAGKKDPSKELEDLQKAAWYLNRKIQLLLAERQGQSVGRPNDTPVKFHSGLVEAHPQPGNFRPIQPGSI